jgi:hypothetical protein
MSNQIAELIAENERLRREIAAATTALGSGEWSGKSLPEAVACLKQWHGKLAIENAARWHNATWGSIAEKNLQLGAVREAAARLVENALPDYDGATCQMILEGVAAAIRSLPLDGERGVAATPPIRPSQFVKVDELVGLDAAAPGECRNVGYIIHWKPLTGDIKAAIQKAYDRIMATTSTISVMPVGPDIEPEAGTPITLTAGDMLVDYQGRPLGKALPCSESAARQAVKVVGLDMASPQGSQQTRTALMNGRVYQHNLPEGYTGFVYLGRDGVIQPSTREPLQTEADTPVIVEPRP